MQRHIFLFVFPLMWEHFSLRKAAEDDKIRLKLSAFGTSGADQSQQATFRLRQPQEFAP